MAEGGEGGLVEGEEAGEGVVDFVGVGGADDGVMEAASVEGGPWRVFIVETR